MAPRRSAEAILLSSYPIDTAVLKKKRHGTAQKIMEEVYGDRMWGGGMKWRISSRIQELN